MPEKILIQAKELEGVSMCGAWLMEWEHKDKGSLRECLLSAC